MAAHRIIQDLIRLGIITETSLKKIHSGTRDRDDIDVLQCERSGVIVLSSIEHSENPEFYSKRNRLEYWSVGDRRDALLATRWDDLRRYQQFEGYLNGKQCLDFGAGNGGFLELASTIASQAFGIEAQEDVAEMIRRDGFQVVGALADLASDLRFDTITSFHVLEHLANPGAILNSIRERMKPGGHLIVEVPHARDALLSFYELPEFAKFTYWSEHLILHTRESLRTTLEDAGFKNPLISGYQRYSLANHLHWLRNRAPGGHEKWAQLDSNGLNTEYANRLKALDMTDTLIAVVQS